MNINNFFVLFFFVLFSPLAYSQFSTYSPLSREEIMAPARMMKQKYDSNAAKVDALIEKIFDLKGQTTDEEFNIKMDKYYNTLKEYYKYDLARMDNEIRDMNHKIMEAVNDYNQKMKMAQNNINNGYESNREYPYNEASNTYTKKENTIQPKERNYIGNIEVMKTTPIYEQPTLGESKTLWWVNNGNTSIVKQVDKNFYQVRSSSNKIGYVWIGWFK